MTSTRLIIITTLVAVAFANARTNGEDILSSVPEKSLAKTNPFAGNSLAQAAGGKLFEQHCAECHGNAAGGSKRGPSLRSSGVEEASPGALFYVLTNGVVRKGMPSWSKLPEAQRWQIITFLKSAAADPPSLQHGSQGPNK